jgi:hypothetical protein
MALMDHYILDEQGNPVPEPDLIKWARWFHDSIEQRRVGSTELGDIHISTVFLGSVHISKELDNDNEMLYETMVFGTDADIARLIELSETDDRSIFTTFFGGFDIQKRYETREQALQGHRNMCIFVDTCLTKGLLDIKRP